MPRIPKSDKATKRLVLHAQQGDAAAFEVLCKAYQDSLYRIAASYLGGHEADIADAVQATLIAAWRALDTLNDPRYVKTWIIRICINECHQLRRSKKDGVPLSAISCDALDTALLHNGATDETAHQACESESNESFKELIALAGPTCAPTMVLYYGEGYTTKEIATLLKISPHAVRQRLSRGRQRIAQSLSQPELNPCRPQGVCNES